MTEIRQNNDPEPTAPTLLRLPVQTHRTAWQVMGAPSPYQISERTYYYDQDAAAGQVYLVTAQVGNLLGSDHTWRYSVGLKIRAGGDTEFLEGFTLGCGDVDAEEAAKHLADQVALAYLDAPAVPARPVPIPNLDLVAHVHSDEAPMDFVKRRLPTVLEFAERLQSGEFAVDERMRAALERVGDDMAWLIATVDELHGWGAEHVQELERITVELAAGDASDGHHTHNQLYEQRLLYHAHLAQRWFAEGVPIVKSWRHHDEQECFGGGWFIVVMELPTGQVSQHYPAWAWNLFHIPEAPVAPVWDGHDPEAGAKRLRDAIVLFPPNPEARTMQRRCPNTGRHDGHYYSASLVFWCATDDSSLEGP